MQVERHPQELPNDVRKQLGLPVFDEPEPFKAEKLESHLNDSTVKEVHVYNNNAENRAIALLRMKHPGASRRRLRRLMNRKK